MRSVLFFYYIKVVPLCSVIGDERFRRSSMDTLTIYGLAKRSCERNSLKNYKVAVLEICNKNVSIKHKVSLCIDPLYIFF